MSVEATPVSAGPAAGYYADQSDVENIFGRDNVAIWSNLDNDDTDADVARIQEALDDADSQINTALRGVYAVPVAVSGDDANVLKRIAATMAGVWLYRNRGDRDAGDKSKAKLDGRYASMLAGVEIELGYIRVGINPLSITRRDDNLSNGPVTG